ncbi:MAG TPA: hypothetical protein ENH87_22400 [Pricia antarctica]|uniref:Uncharacterized protein n=1 Tax=Pricia antarctica TaxID=641691 RepID=A0A831VT97_9FLAO|nr:hypothetical protein [Pricia antarctica]
MENRSSNEKPRTNTSQNYGNRLITVRWQKKAYGTFSFHMLLRGPVEAGDADRPPWLPQGLWLKQV